MQEKRLLEQQDKFCFKDSSTYDSAKCDLTTDTLNQCLAFNKTATEHKVDQQAILEDRQRARDYDLSVKDREFQRMEVQVESIKQYTESRKVDLANKQVMMDGFNGAADTVSDYVSNPLGFVLLLPEPIIQERNMLRQLLSHLVLILRLHLTTRNQSTVRQALSHHLCPLRLRWRTWNFKKKLIL